MKTKIILLLALISIVPKTIWSQTAYAILEDRTLTFKYGTKPNVSNAWDIPGDESSIPIWKNYATAIKTVVFDASFADARPVTCALWFKDCEYLTQIDNMENLNTSMTTNMWGMFYNCKSLANIDFDYFATNRVTDMGYMFFNCEKLTSLNLISFNTTYVTNMSSMFGNCVKLNSIVFGNLFQTRQVTNMTCMFMDCPNLKRLDLSNFHTSNVENMFGMFESCTSLYSIDLSNFNTIKVTDMGSMFSDCKNLKRIDIHNFNISNLTSTCSMFRRCNNLERIICDGDWSGVPESTDMFYGCTSLVGAVPYNSANITASYANKTTGYFSPFFYYIAEISNDSRTLTFRRSETAPNNTTQWDATKTGYEEIDYNETGDDYFEPAYTFHGLSVSKVVFDESFKDARPNSCYCWFVNNTSLTEVEGLEYLNTSEVTNMMDMFYNCYRITSLDLRSFDMSNVENLNQMFYGCYNLETIMCDDDWNTGQATGSYMFYGCSKLKGAISYNSSKKDIQYANPYTGYFTSLEDEITVPSYSICTYCSRFDLDFTNVTGLKAYIVSGFSPSTCTLTLTPVTEVRAGEGLLLKGNAGEYVVPHTTTDMYYSNLLVGVPSTACISPIDGEYTNFILANGSHGVNFYTLSEAGNIAGGKAYLHIPTSELPSSARGFKFDFGENESTSINTHVISEDATCYDLQGRKVKQPTKGLYIVNGNIMIIK